MGFVGDDQVGGAGAVAAVLDDGHEVVLGEPWGGRRQAEGDVDLTDADQGGEFDGGGHLHPHPGGAGRGRLDQPGLGSGTEVEECLLRFVDGLRPRLARAAVHLLRVVGVVGKIDHRPSGQRQLMAGDLRQTRGTLHPLGPADQVGQVDDLREAAKYLNTEGFLTRAGKYWTPTNLRGRLLSAMKGEYVYRNPASAGSKTGTRLGKDGMPVYGETTTIALNPVFSASEIGRLQRALKRNGLTRRKGAPRLHPLSMRIFGKCGKHYTGYCKDERGERWYQCTGKNEKFPGAQVCECSQIDAEALEGRVWKEVCKLLGDPDRLKTMAQDWVGLAARSGIDYDARMAELQEQIDNQDDAIAAAIVMAAREKDAKAAMEKAVAQLKKERADLNEMLEDVASWKAEADAAGQRAKDLQALAETAREKLTFPARRARTTGLRRTSASAAVCLSWTTQGGPGSGQYSRPTAGSPRRTGESWKDSSTRPRRASPGMPSRTPMGTGTASTPATSAG